MPRLQLAKLDTHLPDSSPDLDVGPPKVPGTPPGGLLEVIPLPGTGQVVVITAQLLPAGDVGTPVVVPPRGSPPVPWGRRPTEQEPDDLLVDRDARRVWADGEEVSLTFQEFELLEYLTARPGKVISRLHLMNAVWEGASVAVPRTVDVHVHRLRRKLGRHGARLVTVRRVGYCYRRPEAHDAAP
ncbi:winged helix-turn-helix domain-containing protein [Actinoallomurus rhizosphaericola]|uniref:winged helix-turn-helix domain-containing protein n=1 Tax=Actinoallomurus rhizosphaericola TaxID=2952536 RepID=UPI0020934456|nr:winged helix-turn-helix domain-containing protein [Actinoallomurus rhizosphaericola]MCO5999708.1 winged helix-turn-helix domain-containing protein [Actinoallomurus rhizosphaericola]